MRIMFVAFLTHGTLQAQVATEQVTPDRALATVGRTVEFKAVARDARGNELPGVEVAVFAAPFDVAFAEPKGKVRALRQGEGQIIAVAEGVVGTAILTVAPKPPASLRLTLEAPTTVTGATTVASAVAYTEDLELLRDVRVRYHPSDERVATVDESGAILGLGAYEGGVRALDVSGELRGDLVAQGREIGAVWTGDPDGFRPNLPMAWGAQPHRGFVYVTDMNSGVWVMWLTPKIGT